MVLVKFENKSARVKGLSFHPSRPWILVSLHTGSIQLWDYRIQSLIDRFDSHEGPVRGIDFHLQQPLFVSGGDDYKIKVWNHKLRQCLYTLTGHLDYIRTVYFHHEYPWILSASDDQTIRIWNWQSRSCIWYLIIQKKLIFANSIIPGHNYYVMSAKFHPTEDLIISSSLDQTVRIWDFSGLRRKNVYSGPEAISSQIQRSSGTPDLFGHTDSIVKFVLEGHERGVNWACFHPNIALAASSGDDRQIKLWRMNENRVWELDSCRGHKNNVTCVLFHPTRDLLLSTSEDKTLKIWDLSQRTCLYTRKQENSRFWILAVHPELNLFATGHDNGFFIFKLERERPAFCLTKKKDILFVKNNEIHIFKHKDESDIIIQQLKSVEEYSVCNISYKHGSQSIIISLSSFKQTENVFYIAKFNAEQVDNKTSTKDLPFTGIMQGSAVWISWNKIAVLHPKGVITLKTTSGDDTGAITEFPQCESIYESIEGTLLIKESSNLHMFDVGSNKILHTMHIKKIKHTIWSEDKQILAILYKTGFKIATRSLEELCTVNESGTIKSGLFIHSNQIFIYITLTHVKYTLTNGTMGVLCSINSPLYLVKAVDGLEQFVCLNRSCAVQLLSLDTTECQFKLALEQKRFHEVVKIIKKYEMTGQSILSYLYKSGYPEIALRFVKNKNTQFNLAIECGNIQGALDVARQLDEPLLWRRLSQAAIEQGNINIAEIAYQKSRHIYKLMILYILTGNVEKLDKISKIIDLRGDASVKYIFSLLRGNRKNELEVMKSNAHCSNQDRMDIDLKKPNT